MPPHEVITADVLDWAAHYTGPLFHAVLCDPPYHLTSIVKRFGKEGSAPAQEGSDGRFSRLSRGFMGQEWDGGDVAFRPETWAALGAHLLPGAHLLAFGGTRTWHRLACAIEDAGFELRDTLLWLYGSGFPKSHDVSKGLDKAAGAEREIIGEYRMPVDSTAPGLSPSQGMGYGSDLPAGVGRPITSPATDAARQWEGYGTALKPAWEPIILARKPLDGTVAQNCLKHGCGALNIDGARIANPTGESAGGGWGFTGKNQERLAMQDGWQGTPSERNEQGRWPANVMHDGSEEVTGRFPEGRSSGEYERRSVSVGAREGPASIPTDDSTSAMYTDSGSASRFFYTAKSDTEERERGLFGVVPCMRYGQPGVVHDPDGDAGLTTKRHYSIDDKGEPVRDKHGRIIYGDCRRNPHPTVKPLDLLRYLSLLILPPPLDVPRRLLVPFAGVGSEMIGARQAGFDEVVGVEWKPEYADIARVRLSAFLGMF